MKSVISIYCGSPRKNGNTAFVTKYIFEQINSLIKVELSLYHLIDYKIDVCHGCRKCMSLNHCINQNDDFAFLFNTVKESDITIWGVPVYWCAPPGITKNFIDRTHGYFTRPSMLFNKSAYLINIASDSGFRTNEIVMKSWLDWFGVELKQSIDIYATESNDIKKNKLKIEQINQFVRRIIKDLSAR